MKTPRQAEAQKMCAELGVTGAAKAMGLGRSTVQELRDKANKWDALDPATTAAMTAANSQAVPRAFWTKTGKDGEIIGHSVMFVPEKIETPPEDVLDRIADRLNRILPAPAISRPPTPRADLRNFIPLFDVHLSMRVGSYGTAAAVERLRSGSRDIIERLPSAECTIIVNGGDFTENNDPSNLTPQSKHPLAVDAEYDETTDVAVDVTAEMIDLAATRSEHVIYKALRGNHDPATARILRAALRERYRDNPRVTIETTGIEFFVHEWEGNLACAFHGDIKRNIKDILMSFAARHYEAFGRTRCREVYYGHDHHLLAQDFPGWRTNRVRAICPAGRYAKENLYTAPSEMIGVTYKAGGGRLGAVDHCFDLEAA